MQTPQIIYNKILQFISSGSKHLLLYNYIYINKSNNHSNKNIEQRVKNVINEAISSDSNY